jgi:hypothetical protein
MFKRHSISAFSLAPIFFTLSVILQDKTMNCVAQLYMSADANLTFANIRDRCNINKISKKTAINKLSPTHEKRPYLLTVAGNRSKNQVHILNLPVTFRWQSD